MSDAAMNACLDTVVRMLVCRDPAEACWSAHHAGVAPLPLDLKDINATSVSKQWIHFKCPLGSPACTTCHMAPVPPSKSGAAKAEYVVDTKTILSCLGGALQRNAWSELSGYVVQDYFRGLRINITVDTIVDLEDETIPVDLEHQARKFAALSDKGKLAATTTALVRQAVEQHRSKAAQSAHICVAVACQMARYRLSMK
jgi:hypothetical protein